MCRRKARNQVINEHFLGFHIKGIIIFRCNLGGENTCYYSCKALGYRNGMCDAQDNCECGGGNNRWGDLIENVRDRL